LSFAVPFDDAQRADRVAFGILERLGLAAKRALLTSGAVLGLLLGLWAFRRTSRDSELTSTGRAAHSTTVVAAKFVNRALALSWQSVVETRFAAGRLSADHTTTVRLMAAYEAAYRGVALADGSGGYRLGLAPYSSLGTPALEVAVGGATFTHPLPDPVLTDNDFRNGVPRQPLRKWRQLTITRTSNEIRIYLDGARLGAFSAGSAPELGTLRFGRLAAPGEFQDQFYGLIDDVAIFERALSDLEIRALAQKPRLDGTEPGLVAAWLFDEDSSARSAPFALQGSSTLREVSSARVDAMDNAQLPKPAHRTRFTLPFAEGQVWLVIQGVNSRLSHNDSAAFALDFLRVEPSLAMNNPSRLPGGSHAASLGAPFTAAADGKVVARVACFPDDNGGKCPTPAYRDPLRAAAAGAAANRNLLCLTHAPQEVSCALHLGSGSLRVALGEQVARGRELGAVGKTGAPSVHLHFALSDLPEPNEPGTFAPLVTLPFSFSDYEVSNDFGASWQRVSEGTPSPGEWLRP
jgi:hypothetical protein